MSALKKLSKESEKYIEKELEDIFRKLISEEEEKKLKEEQLQFIKKRLGDGITPTQILDVIIKG